MPDTNGPLGTPLSGRHRWVQTEREAHMTWGDLVNNEPKAGALLHKLVALMQHQNAVVVSQSVLAKMLQCTTRTIQRAQDVLVAGNWIDVRQIGQRGTVNAYIINDRVAWGEKRERMGRLSAFSAQVITAECEQIGKSASVEALRTARLTHKMGRPSHD